MNYELKKKPDMSFWNLWNLSFGFFGVQIAYALQSANISRIFATLGADPHNLSYFWILPPLMGIVVHKIWASHPLLIHRSCGCCIGNVPAPTVWLIRHDGIGSNDFRTCHAHVPRHLYQYGDATL